MQHDFRRQRMWEPRNVGRFWITGVLVAGLAIVSVGCSSPTGTQPPEDEAQKQAGGGSADALEIETDVQRAVGLAVEAVQQRSIAETILTTGIVGPDETRVARVRPLAEGRITRVAVRVGDHVTAGQTLLTYDSITGGELISEHRSAVAGLARARAEADVAQRSLERADNLVDIGAVAKGERERRAAEHQRAVADIASAQARVTSLEQKLSRLGTSPDALARVHSGGELDPTSASSVSAPFAGVVLEVHASAGEVMAPDRELFVIADLSRVWVQGDVYQRDIAKVRVGQDAVVTVDTYPGERFVGTVTHVSDVLDPDTRTAKVRCEVVNRDGRLKSQMFAMLALPVSAQRTALVIPSKAVQDIDGVPTVFVRVGEKRFETRPVRVNAAIGDGVEITEGLGIGESVVTDGALMLKSRLKLRVEEE